MTADHTALDRDCTGVVFGATLLSLRTVGTTAVRPSMWSPQEALGVDAAARRTGGAVRCRHARVMSMYQLVSHVRSPSAENACSHRADRGVIRDQVKRTRTGVPSWTSSP